MTNDVITAKEAAEMFGISERTLYRLAKRLDLASEAVYRERPCYSRRKVEAALRASQGDSERTTEG